MRYDATPPDLRVRALAPLSLDERVREFASAMELWWFQRVVGFDRSDQIHALKRAWMGWAGSRRPEGERARGAKPAIWKGLESAPWREGTVLALCFAGAVAAVWWLRPKKHRKGLPIAYSLGLELLARHGLRRAPTATARDFAAAVRAAYPAAGPAFEAITEGYLGERFGDFPDPGGQPSAGSSPRKSRARGRAP